MSKHTPTPWKVNRLADGHIDIDGIGQNALAHLQTNQEANAAHIVKCVNAHDALREALERLKAEYCAYRYDKGDLPRTVGLDICDRALALSAKGD